MIAIVVLIGFWIWCLVDFSRTPRWAVRTFEPNVWILLLVFTNVFGGLLWVMLGRPRDHVRR